MSTTATTTTTTKSPINDDNDNDDSSSSSKLLSSAFCYSSHPLLPTSPTSPNNNNNNNNSTTSNNRHKLPSLSSSSSSSSHPQSSSSSPPPDHDRKDTNIVYEKQEDDDENENNDESSRRHRVATHDLIQLFGFQEYNNNKEITTMMMMEADTKNEEAMIPSVILSGQVSYAGSNPSQESQYSTLSKECLNQIPPILLDALDIGSNSQKVDVVDLTSESSRKRKQRRRRRLLYKHQVSAIEAAIVHGKHVSVCTGTGSGKSLCFLLPVLSAAYRHNATSILLFPTKALAQDQLTRLLKLLSSSNNTDLKDRIRPATLDGDTPHSVRSRISDCNIILTNPDTLHAALLPNWKMKGYKPILENLQYLVVDESHTYNGVFGAHVAMVLRRLVRLCRPNVGAAAPIFLAASATLPWPEEHFRNLFPIAPSTQIPIVILTNQDDTSPRAAKHFFVWNPPVLNIDGTSTGKVRFPRPSSSTQESAEAATVTPAANSRNNTATQADATYANSSSRCGSETSVGSKSEIVLPVTSPPSSKPSTEFHRRHAADETARLFARAVSQGVRCIAFCKTRNLVEWVYSKALDALKSNPETAELASKIESYRGGYSMEERRKIEERLFQNQLLGVVGTNALELGVDIGGIDVTLHCGYPTSYASLLQQAGRAGRGADRLDTPSVSVVVTFNSPTEQQIWKRPKSLLGKGLSLPNTMPIRGDLVQGHLLCASEEFPLAGAYSVASIAGGPREQDDDLNSSSFVSDRDLFGPSIYDDALDLLQATSSVTEEKIADPKDSNSEITIFKARPSLRKAWSRISLRSIEPITYSIVNLSHPSQGGRMDGIHDTAAVLDTIPYSRVFYHAHPGAIITHRARKYKIISMMQPPAFVATNFNYRRNVSLAAYAKPSQARYVTRPLSSLQITVVKQMESVELWEDATSPINSKEDGKNDSGRAVTFAGCGAVSVKREVNGYKKLSVVNRTEISRSELSGLPPIEFDSFGLYICTAPDALAGPLGERYGPGVHALSHALLSVAPLFGPGLTRDDLECDHAYFAPTRVVLFDERAGGSGCVERLWKCFFQPNGILEAAIGLLKDCSSCNLERGYDGGCPACLHASNCINFNNHLSRAAAIVIGEHMLDRIKSTELYKQNDTCGICEGASEQAVDTTPRRKARSKAMQRAKEMRSARERQYVVARPSWPLDGGNA